MKKEFESVLLMVDMCLPDESIDGGRATADYKNEVEDHLKKGGQLIFIQMMASEPGRPQGLEKLNPKQWENTDGAGEGPALMSLHFKQDSPQAPNNEATRVWLSNLLKNGVSDGANDPKMLANGQICLCAKSLESALLSKSQMAKQMEIDIPEKFWNTSESKSKLIDSISGSGHNGLFLVDELLANQQLKEIKIAGANATHCVGATLLNAFALWPLMKNDVKVNNVRVIALTNLIFDAAFDKEGVKLKDADINTPSARMPPKIVAKTTSNALEGLKKGMESIVNQETLQAATECLESAVCAHELKPTISENKLKPRVEPLEKTCTNPHTPKNN